MVFCLGDMIESFVADESKVIIEETCVNLDCVKKEPNEEVLDIGEENVKQYRITLEYENIFAEASRKTKLEKADDNLIGFLNNDVLMKNTMIELEDIKEKRENEYFNICKFFFFK